MPNAQPAYSWSGTYDLVGRDFPDGERRAVLVVTRVDTAHVIRLEGPPGRALRTHVVGDSVHVLWELEPGFTPMFVALRGIGDSVTGRWEQGAASGPIYGRRRQLGRQ